MSPRRWKLPTLSIRGAVLGAIVVGVVLPAVVMLTVDERLSRREHEALIERNREALVTLSAAALSQPVWLGGEDEIRATITAVMRDPSVCAVEVVRHDRAATPVVEERCAGSQRTVRRVDRIEHSGRLVGSLRISFDDTEVDTLLAERRGEVGRQLVLQVMVGAIVLMGVLSIRLLRPIDRLKASASAIASRSPAPSIDWRRRDELGQLGQHLNQVRERIDELIGELERKNSQLRKMAMYDHLTGLPNRTLFKELFTHELPVARRAHQPMALLFIDLDRFKAVNDTLGHAAGDEVLLATSQRLQQVLRHSDLVCRVSGDEFLVLLRQAESWDLVASTAERLLHALQAPLPLANRPGSSGHEVQVSASIGVALFPRDGEDFDALVKYADLAMYQSKQQGRGCVSFYHPDLHARRTGRADLERELAQAIRRHELVLHYQPVVDATTGRLLGCEALLRWQHPSRGMLLPSHFIGVAEESGLIRELGMWTIDAACAQMREWRTQGRAPSRIAVNVSAMQLRDQRLVETLRRAIGHHAVEAEDIEIELTESTLMDESEASQRTVAELRRLGVSLVIDDFGTGYSSLSYLKRLKPDKLKIDRSFVNDLAGDADDRALVQAILRMAQALDIDVVAEGVETAAQRDFLDDNGCPLLQGYLTGRPVPAADFARHLGAVAPPGRWH